MIKKFLTIFAILTTTLASQAYQDCIITNNDKLTNIKIEDNSMINVYPLVTVMNEKNTLIVHPLKTGKTKFCALKDNKNIVMFIVEATESVTSVYAPDGFDVMTLDEPYSDPEFIIDEPPEVNVTNTRTK